MHPLFDQHMCPSPSMSLSHLQVKATGKDGIQIPDHEVITRRDQFRMKKDRAEEKRQKKEQKKEDTKANKAKQAAKKAEKAAKQADKEQMKADKGSGKRGRKSAEKSKDMQAKRRQNKKNQEINDSETHEQEEAAPLGHEPDQEQKSCKARGRRMKRLQQMTRSHKTSSVSAVDAANKPKKAKKKVKHVPQPENDKTDGNQSDKTVNIKDGNKDDPDHKEMPTTDQDKVVEEPEELEVKESDKKGMKSSGSGLKKTAAKSKPKSTQQPKATAKAKSKQSKKTSDGTDPEKKTSKKRTTKHLGETDENGETNAKPKRTRRSTKPGTTAEVDPQVKDAVAKILVECEESKCTHPSWEKTKNKFIDIQPYTGRLSCGLKAPRSFFSNHKAHGKGKAHVTYFGCKTTCIYTNMILGSLWVSRLHLSVCLKGSGSMQNNE